MKNKDINYYVSLNHPMTIEWDAEDKVFFVEFPDLPGCIAHGATPDEAVAFAKDVKRDWIEAALEGGVPIPEPEEREYSGKFVVRVPSALHGRLAEQAKREGRSLNAHVVALLSERSAALAVKNEVAAIGEAVERAVAEKLDALAAKAVDKKLAVRKVASASSCPLMTVNMGEAAMSTSTEYTENMERKFDA